MGLATQSLQVDGRTDGDRQEKQDPTAFGLHRFDR
jgi:hypothetical protein